jgi:hypothetical protein
VVPIAQRGSGISTVRVVHSTPGTRLHREVMKAEKKGKFLEVGGRAKVAKQAFVRQT